MSSFSYGEHTRRHIGVWLKPAANPDVMLLIKKSKLKKIFDSVRKIVVSEYDKSTDEVWLEIYCSNLIDVIRRKYRYNVFYIKTKVNPYWSCNGDMGKQIYK